MCRVLGIVVSLALIAVPTVTGAQITSPATMEEAEREWRAADADLNATWQRCIAPESATVQSIAALRKAQQGWAAYRDQNARAYQLGQSSREPLDDLYYVHARAVMTKSRIAELKALFECE
jgi:uncharacterized protein YecT (DUF1311 family)